MVDFAKANKINKTLRENYKIVEDMGYECVGVFLQGSQNYRLDYDGSDIDCKAILLPKFEDFCLNKQPVSTTHVLPSNEHIDLKDIRLMFDCFKKQNINFVEILFTPYNILNPKYELMVAELLERNEDIAKYNNYASINAMAGMCMEKYKALEHPYPATMDKIEKYGYDGKQLSHMIRLKEFMERFISGEKFSKCLISKQKDYLINVKVNKEYTLEEARIVAKETNDKVYDIKTKYMAENPLVVNKDVEDLLNQTLIDIMKKNFRTELGVK